MGTWKKLLQRSWPDYLSAVALMIMIGIVLNVVSPAKRLLDQNVLEDLGYPVKGKYISNAVNGTLTWMIPVVIMAVAGAYGRFTVFRTHEHCVSFFIAHVLSALVTIGFRRLIGRPRPDFLQRCFEGTVPFDLSPKSLETNFIRSPITTSLEPICTGNSAKIDFGYTSFPSTQGALSTAGGLYVTLFLIHLWGVFGPGRSFQALVSLVPLVFGVWLSVITFTDYAHHATDVVAGMAIGAAAASYFFFQAHNAQEGPEDVREVPVDVTARVEERANGAAGVGASENPAPAADNANAADDSGVQMRDMYAAVEIARAKKQNPFG